MCLLQNLRFGLPIYRWRPQQSALFSDIRNWMKENEQAGKNSVLAGLQPGQSTTAVV